MIRLLVPVVLLLAASSLRAQSPFFSLFHDQDTMIWSDHFVVESTSGDIVEVCRLAELSPDTNYLIFRRFSPNGTLLAATRTIPPVGIALQMQAGIELPDGSFLFFGADFPKAVVVHLDPMGALISVHRRTGASAWYQNVIQLNDSTILASGIDAPSNQHSLLLSHFDMTGQHLGSTGLRMNNDGANAIASIRSSTGGILLCASGEETTDSSWSSVGSTLLIELDDQGNAQWAKRYTDPGRMFWPAGLGSDEDGHLYIGGNLWRIGDYTHAYMLETDAMGVPLTALELADATDPMNTLTTRGFTVRPDGSQLFTGSAMVGSYLLALDTNGAVIDAQAIPAAHTLDKPVASSAGDLLIAVAAPAPTSGVALGLWRTADPFALNCSTPVSITVAGVIPQMDTAFSQEPVSMVFEDITSLCLWNASIMTAYAPCAPDAIHEQVDEKNTLLIWPSPTAGPFTIRTPKATRVELADMSGRIILAKDLRATEIIEQDISSLPSGLYHVRTATARGWLAGMLVKE